jgi:hypothetical protein
MIDLHPRICLANSAKESRKSKVERCKVEPCPIYLLESRDLGEVVLAVILDYMMMRPKAHKDGGPR